MHRNQRQIIIFILQFCFAFFVLSPAMIITGVRTLFLAKIRRFDQHRQWAMYHEVAGYTIPLATMLSTPVENWRRNALK